MRRTLFVVKRIRRTLFATLVSFALIGSSLAIAGSAIGAEESNPQPLSEAGAAAQTANARNFRESMGFSATASFVKSTLSSASLDDSRYGVPLTAGEIAEVDRRHALAAKIDDIAKVLKPANVLGGAWIDNPNGGVLTIEVTAPSASVQKLVSSVLGATDLASTKIVTSTYTEDYLNSVEASITATTPSWTSWGVTRAAVDIPNNRIAVSITPNSPVGIEQTLKSKFGPAVIVSRDGVKYDLLDNRRIKVGPLYGGSYIESPSVGCTVGYSHVQENSTNIYLTVTAGHCGPLGTSMYRGTGFTNGIGTVRRNPVASNAVVSCDCEAIGQMSHCQ